MNKKQQAALLVLLLLALLIIAVRGLRQASQPLPRPKVYTKFPDFGVEIPQRYKLQGLDVSKYQGVIKWSWIKDINYAGRRVNFVFIKATQGTTSVDPQFTFNFRQAFFHQIPRGAYHYFEPHQDGLSQALHFIRTVALQPGDLPPVLDIEQVGYNGNEALHRELRTFLRAIEQAYKVKPIIYTYAHFYRRHLGDAFDEYPLWIAHYNGAQAPRSNRDWQFWQMSEEARASGIIGAVDLNVFVGDSSAFEKMRLPKRATPKRSRPHRAR